MIPEVVVAVREYRVVYSAKAFRNLQISRARDLWGHRFEVLASLGSSTRIAADTSICGECGDLIVTSQPK